MSITQMSLIEVIVPRADLESLLKCVQLQGSLQLEEVPLVVPGFRSYLHREQLSEDEKIEARELREVVRLLSDLEKLFESLPAPTAEECESARESLPSEQPKLLLLRSSRLKRKAESIWRKRNNISADINALSHYSQRLEQLSGLKTRMSFGESLDHVALQIHPVDHERITDLAQELNDLTQGNSELLVEQDLSHQKGHEHQIALLAFPEEYADKAHALIRQGRFSEIRLPRHDKGLPFMESVRMLQEHLKGLPAALERMDKEIEDFRNENAANVRVILESAEAALLRLNAHEMLAHSNMLSVMHAWLPSSGIDALQEDVQRMVSESSVVNSLREETVQAPHVPVRLSNNPFVRPFEHLIRLVSDPMYGTFDPTPLMAITFPLFFGLILGDAAYGLIIAGLGVAARSTWKENSLTRDLGFVAICCGLSSVVFGVIFGEFLGDLPHRLGIHSLGPLPVPIWDERKFIVDKLLYLSIGIGYFHILLALFLGVVQAGISKDKHHFGERLGLLIGLIGMPSHFYGLMYPESNLIIPGGIMIAIGIILLFIYSGPVGPVELISLVANVLSYSRLMALGVAGMVIADLANALADKTGNILLGILVAAPIHMLAILLGILEPAIHSLRLHFVEFLPKFFVGDGRPYSPLTRKGNSI